MFVSSLALLSSLGLYLAARTLAPQRTSAGRGRRRLLTACAVVAVGSIVVELAARRLAPFGGGLWRPLVWSERVATFLCLVAMVQMVALRTAAAPFAWAAAIVDRLRARVPPTTAPVGPEMSRREVLLQALSAGAVGASTTAVLYGSLRERHDVETVDVRVTIPALPPSLEGLTIAQITDLHAGIFTGRRELEHVVERVNALRADVVVVTGDIVDNNPAHIRDAMRLLSKLRGRLGTYTVLGNHDLYTGGAAVQRALDAAGLPCLVNRAVKVHTGDVRRGALTLAGVADVMARRHNGDVPPDLDEALRGADPEAPVVLLAHNPVFFDRVDARVAVQLSGHTHGGQVNVGGVARSVLRYVAGRYTRGDSTLYVSRGIGITGAPVRLAAAPEITRIEVTRHHT